MAYRWYLQEDDADDETLICVAIWHQMVGNSLISQPKKHGGSLPGRAPKVEKDFAAGHQRIMLDYFWPVNQLRNDGSGLTGPVYPECRFERRFRMPRNVFDLIFERTVINSAYLRAGLRPNCTGKLGASPLQKTVAAMRQLAYGASADSMDEYCRIGESTALKSLKRFCEAVVHFFENIPLLTK